MKVKCEVSEAVARGLCEAIVDDAIECGELSHDFPDEFREMAVHNLMKTYPRTCEIDGSDDRVSEIYVDVVG